MNVKTVERSSRENMTLLIISVQQEKDVNVVVVLQDYALHMRMEFQ